MRYDRMSLLTPAFRRNREGTVFTGVCLFTLWGGVPPSGWWRGVPPSFPMGGSTPILPDEGTPTLANTGGYPHPRSGQRGTPPSKVRTGGYHHPRSGQGVPPSKVRMRVLLSQVRMGGTLGSLPSRSGPRSGWGYFYPRSEWGVPPPHSGQVPGQDEGYPQLEQCSMYSLRGGWYASCVHALGFSYTAILFYKNKFYQTEF